MGLKLKLTYLGLNDLASHLVEHADRGAMLLPLPEIPESVRQYDTVDAVVEVSGQQTHMVCEVVQVLPGTGLVVRVTEPGNTEEMVAYATFSEAAGPPKVEVLEVGEGEPGGGDGDPEGGGSPSGGVGGTAGGNGGAPPAGGGSPGREVKSGTATSPTLWSVERLRAEWDNLSPAQRIRVARYGRRDARHMILKDIDKKMHNHVLSNPKVTPDEVASMAGMAGLDPDTLRRIANSPEWVRHKSVVRNLVCNPKMNLPQVQKLIKHLPQDELRRLSRSGKVRGAVKQAIIKKIEGGR